MQSRASSPARQASYALRARARYLTGSKRERGCGAWSVQTLECDPWLEVRRDEGRAHAKWCGLMTCGHIWTCAVCAQAKRAKRGELLDAAIRGAGGRWQMLTFTVRHHDGQPLATTHAGLMTAVRKARQSRAVRAIYDAKVTMSARAVEIPHGKNGWHPHCHVLVRSLEWSETERAKLLDAYKSAVRAALGNECLPDDVHAVFWSDGFDAGDAAQRGQYLTKLAFEVSGLGTKTGKQGSLSAWQVCDRAARGEQKYLRLWQEYYAATKGRRAYELDERATEAGKRQLILDADDKQQQRDQVGVDTVDPEVEPVVRVPVKTRDFEALRRAEQWHPSVLADVLADVEREGTGALGRWLVYVMREAAA
jgi:hypothetical protein